MTEMSINSVLRYFQRLHQLTSEQANDIQLAMDRIMDHNTVASPTDNDHKTVSRSVRSKDRQRLWGQVQFNCLHMAANVADHARAVTLLLSQPSIGIPTYAHSTIARVAIESAANIAYILDRDAPFNLRFARGIAFLVSNSDAARRAAIGIPGNAYMPAPGPAMTRDHQTLLATLDRARIQIVLNRNGDPKGVRIAPTAPEAPIDVKMTVLVRDRYPNMPGIYNLLSGITHGMPFKLDDNARVIGRHAQWDVDPLDVGASVLAITNAAYTMLTAHAWHRGLEGDPAIAATRDRIAAVDETMQRFGRDHMSLPRPAPALPFLNIDQ